MDGCALLYQICVAPYEDRLDNCQVNFKIYLFMTMAPQNLGDYIDDDGGLALNELVAYIVTNWTKEIMDDWIRFDRECSKKFESDSSGCVTNSSLCRFR